MEANERIINAVRNGPFIGSSETPGLPRIPRSGSSVRRRILVQQGKPPNQHKNIPTAGQEYDFRRTPDSMKSGSRRLVQGTVRPQLPANTRLMEEGRPGNLTSAAVRPRNKLIERLNVARCPTPMPADDDSDDVRLNYPNLPLESSRSAWDDGLMTARTNMGTDGDGIVYPEIDTDTITPRHQNISKRNVISIGHKLNGNTFNHDSIAPDIDREYGAAETPASASTLDLTENVIHYYFQRSLDKDKRIVSWLADCEEKSKSSNHLPALLPDILASRRNITLIVEDV